MEIFINEDKIDFQLEEEKFLEEVVAGLNSWAAGSGVRIQDITYDNQSYSHSDSTCRKVPVDDVSVLTVNVKSMLEIHQDNLHLLYQYISLLLKSIEAKNSKLTAELKTEADPIIKLLAEFLDESYGSTDSVHGRLNSFISELNPEILDEKSEVTDGLIKQLTALKIVLNERISELTNPIGELKKTTNALQLSLGEINDISILLQSGKDREALNIIIKFSELSQKTLRLYPILKNTGIINIENIIIDDKNLSEYYNDLNSILSELIEAFTANDSVLIGDLLEYEVAPRLESLMQVLVGIQEENLK